MYMYICSSTYAFEPENHALNSEAAELGKAQGGMNDTFLAVAFILCFELLRPSSARCGTIEARGHFIVEALFWSRRRGEGKKGGVDDGWINGWMGKLLRRTSFSVFSFWVKRTIINTDNMESDLV